MEQAADLERFLATVESRAGDYAGLYLQAFVVHDGGAWRLHFGKAMFTDVEPAAVADLDYGEHRAITEFVDTARGVEILRNLGATGGIKIGGHTLDLGGRFDFSPGSWNYHMKGYWPSDGRAIGIRWPCNIAFVHPEKAAGHKNWNGPFVGKGLPLYPDFEALVRHRSGAEIPSGQYQGQLVLLAPNYEARIARAEERSRALIVEVEARHTPLDDLRLKVYADAGIVIHEDVDLAEINGQYRLDLRARPSAWNVVLIHRDSEVIVDYRSSQAAERLSEVDLAGLDEETLGQVVAHGENTQREFKPVPFNEKGARSIAQSAVAFANSEGGVIFVGVTDEAVIEGIGRGDLADSIASIIRDRSSPPVTATVVSVAVGEKFVYAVHVPRGNQKPHYLVPDNLPLVRVGSTDRRATREEVEEMTRSANGLGYPYDSPRWRSS